MGAQYEWDGIQDYRDEYHSLGVATPYGTVRRQPRAVRTRFDPRKDAWPPPGGALRANKSDLGKLRHRRSNLRGSPRNVVPDQTQYVSSKL